MLSSANIWRDMQKIRAGDENFGKSPNSLVLIPLRANLLILIPSQRLLPALDPLSIASVAGRSRQAPVFHAAIDHRRSATTSHFTYSMA